MSGLRPLTEKEAAVLDAVLGHEFEGVGPLRVQAADVLAHPSCQCGCGTIDLVPQQADPPRSTATSAVPVDVAILGDTGEPVGGVVLFVRDGLLDSLEVFSFVDGSLQMPSRDRLAETR